MNSESEIKKSKDKQSKSHPILAMALIASLSVIVIFIATFLLLQLKFKEPLEITLSDWLKMILPIVGGALVVIFAFLGIDRLKNYDERLDILSQELRSDLGSRLESELKVFEPLKNSEERLDKLSQELRSNLSSQVENELKVFEPRMKSNYNEWEKTQKEELDALSEKFSERFKDYDEKINRYNKVLGSLETLDEVSAIGNVYEAWNFLEGLFSCVNDDKMTRKRTLLALVERVKNKEIKGDCDDYHNLSSVLARNNYYDCAADVANVGLALFPYNIDLMSDILLYSKNSGDLDSRAVKTVLSRLADIDREKWNWRAFTFTINVINGGQATQENKTKALELVEKYKEVLPDDERAYMAEYETYIKHGELENAEKALENAEKELAMTAQCSLTLSEIYHNRGEYDKAIRSATRAILGQAETQPSSGTGAAFAQRGFSKDAKIHKAILNDADINTLCDDIKSAMADYKMALSFGYIHPNIQTRIQILEGLLPIDAVDIPTLLELDSRITALDTIVQVICSRMAT